MTVVYECRSCGGDGLKACKIAGCGQGTNFKKHTHVCEKCGGHGRAAWGNDPARFEVHRVGGEEVRSVACGGLN